MNWAKNRMGLLVSGLSLVGLVASFWQTAEKIHLLQYPEDPLSCNINPIVDCGTVLSNKLSAVFGVPNSMIGMVIFSLLLMAGLMMLSGVSLKKATKRLILLLTLGVFAFAVWFFAVSLYVIGKICIFCVFIWASSIPLVVLVSGEYGDTLFGNSKLVKWKLKWFKTRPLQPIVVLYALALVLFLYRFRDYYFG